MLRNLFRLAVAVNVITACGCQSLTTEVARTVIGQTPAGGMAYDIDDDKIGTGQQAIVPRNNADYWNGQAMESRPHK